MVQDIDVEIAKVNFAGSAGSLASKGYKGVREDVEEIELNVLASERFSSIALYGEGFSAEISGTAIVIVIILQ